MQDGVILPQGMGAAPRCICSCCRATVEACAGVSWQGQSGISYLTRVTLHQVKLLKSLVIGWWMVLGKLALLEYR